MASGSVSPTTSRGSFDSPPRTTPDLGDSPSSPGGAFSFDPKTVQALQQQPVVDTVGSVGSVGSGQGLWLHRLSTNADPRPGAPMTGASEGAWRSTSPMFLMDEDMSSRCGSAQRSASASPSLPEALSARATPSGSLGAALFTAARAQASLTVPMQIPGSRAGHPSSRRCPEAPTDLFVGSYSSVVPGIHAPESLLPSPTFVAGMKGLSVAAGDDSEGTSPVSSV